MLNRFDRHSYTKHEFTLSEDGTAVTDVIFTSPGVFRFYVTSRSGDGGGESHEGHCIVPPQYAIFSVNALFRLLMPLSRIRLTIRGTLLPLEGINLMTVIPKCLGTIDQWPDQFRELGRVGYNMIHFAPLQERYDPTHVCHSF